MEIKISVPEVVKLINEIEARPESIFEMVRMNVQEEVGKYLNNLMEADLTNFLGREKYKRGAGKVNYRNGKYSRRFCIKGIGEVGVNVPRDRNGEFQTQVLPRSKQGKKWVRSCFLQF